jgi:hypothetical protein
LSFDFLSGSLSQMFFILQSTKLLLLLHICAFPFSVIRLFIHLGFQVGMLLALCAGQQFQLVSSSAGYDVQSTGS